MNWENRKYQKIEHAVLDEGLLSVGFANGDEVSIQIERVLPPATALNEARAISFNDFEVVIPARPNDIEIPWDKIRVLTDPNFSKHMASQAEREAREVGARIRRLREKKGIKSNELADRSGLTPQTITRIEKGYTDVGFISLRKILAAMGSSLKDLANEELESNLTEKSPDALYKKLSKLGIDISFLNSRIIPSNLRDALKENRGREPDLLLEEVANYVAAVYGWSTTELWDMETLSYKNDAADHAFYKRPSNSNANQVRAYSHYAFYIAKTILKSFNKDANKSYPGDIEEFKRTLVSNYNGIELSSIISYSWDMGICVVPLNDPGVFHGASWNIDGRHVIILKQNTTSHAKWIYNLLHELYHVFDHLQSENDSIIEYDEISPFSSNDSIEEREANSFASRVLFGSRAEELAEQCVKMANWKVEGLKNAVEKVAKENNIRVDFLANYIAYRLSFQGQNWWATANNLQITSPDPFNIVLTELKSKINKDMLNPIEQNVLTMALTNVNNN